MTERPTSRTEAEAWEDLRGRWEDDSAHQEYLGRFQDLEGLAEAGRRYRAALEERPGDPVAARWRDEVVKRAAVQGLARLPRAPAPRPVPRWVRVALGAAALALAAWGLLGLAGGGLGRLLRASREALR